MNGEKVCTLAIYPKYANRIFAGDKLFEFRKRCPDWLRTGAQIILFSAGTPKNILGGFTVVGVWHGTPETLWKRTSAHAGIDRNSYLRYYEGYSDAYAFRISKVWKAKVSLTVFDLCGHDESFTVLTQNRCCWCEIGKAKGETCMSNAIFCLLFAVGHMDDFVRNSVQMAKEVINV